MKNKFSLLACASLTVGALSAGFLLGIDRDRFDPDAMRTVAVYAPEHFGQLGEVQIGPTLIVRADKADAYARDWKRSSGGRAVFEVCHFWPEGYEPIPGQTFSADPPRYQRDEVCHTV
ncbi:MAG: hypothetical protein ACREGR_02585 [Minisyncoccia bacterium]